MDRRSFLKGLISAAATAAAPKLIFDMGANLYKHELVYVPIFPRQDGRTIWVEMGNLIYGIRPELIHQIRHEDLPKWAAAGMVDLCVHPRKELEKHFPIFGIEDESQGLSTMFEITKVDQHDKVITLERAEPIFRRAVKI